MIKKAGIAVFRNDELLIIHPTGASWNKPFYSIPKGLVEENESLEDAARREFFEETGIEIKQKLKGPFTYDYGAGKQFVVYVLHIKEYSEIGLHSAVVDKKQLQPEEVDWAGFLKIDDVRKKLYYKQLGVLDHFIKENKYIKPYGSEIK